MDYVKHYIMIGNEQQGPYTFGQLKRMFDSGQINPETMHFMDGYTEWHPLEFILDEMEEKPTRVVPPPLPKRQEKPSSKFLLWLIPVGVVLFFVFMKIMLSQSETNRPQPSGGFPVNPHLSLVREALAAEGATIQQTSETGYTVTLPLDLAMIINEVQAKEIAMMAQEKLGNVTVRVQTPAGQTLATSR